MAHRRDFLKTALLGAAAIGLGGTGAPAVFAKPRREPLTTTPLSDTLTLISGAGGNVVMLKNEEGVLLVDSGSAERSAELLKLVRKSADGAPLKALFNTHWHWDHTGGNERMADAGARIIAHENTRLWLGADFYVEWEDRAYKPRPKKAWPTETFYTGGRMSFGGEEVVFEHLPRAHTDGDIYVFFPSQNVVVAGGLLSVGEYPVLDFSTGGWIGGMVDATAALLEKTDANTRFVPARGSVQNRAALEAQHQMLSTLKDRLVGLMKKGYGPQDMIEAQPTKEFDAQWGDPKQFIANAYRGLWGHVRSLGGIV